MIFLTGLLYKSSIQLLQCLLEVCDYNKKTGCGYHVSNMYIRLWLAEACSSLRFGYGITKNTRRLQNELSLKSYVSLCTIETLRLSVKKSEKLKESVFFENLHKYGEIFLFSFSQW